MNALGQINMLGGCHITSYEDQRLKYLQLQFQPSIHRWEYRHNPLAIDSLLEEAADLAPATCAALEPFWKRTNNLSGLGYMYNAR